jgi:PKD repeat protein
MRTILCIILSLFLSFSLMAQRDFISFDKSQSEPSEDPIRTIQDNGLNGITIEYQFGGAWMSNRDVEGTTYQTLSIPDFSHLMEVGKPALPSHNDIIAIPVGATAQIEIISYDVTEVNDVLVFPALQPAADMVGAPEPSFEIDEAFYLLDTKYPTKIAEINAINYYKGVPLGIVQIHPIQYNPKEKKLYVYSNIKYKVTFSQSNEFLNKEDFSDNALHMFPNYVINGTSVKKEIDEYLLTNPNKGVSGPSKEYIIITPDVYSAAADTLAHWKRQMGYSVEVVSQATWTNTQVQDAVQQRYQNWTPKPDYVVIIGDHDLVPGEIIVGSYGTFATDLYMVCMDGSNDYYPDMAKGRISVSSATEAMNTVLKIMNYERNPPTQASYYTDAVNCAYFQESATAGYAERRFAQTSEDIRNYVVGSQGYNVERIYYTGSSTTPTNWNNGTYSAGEALPSYLLKPTFAWDGDATDINNSINSGAFYVFHRDHGSDLLWGDPSYNTTDMNGLSNVNLTTVVFSINCLTGKFLGTECFSEKFLRLQDKGAAGVFCHAEVSYSGWNDGLALGLIDAIWSSPGLVPNFTGSGGVNNPTLSSHSDIFTMGDVANQGLIRMVETWSDNEYTHQLFHYFGDPAMKMWTAQPTLVTATHTTTLSCKDSIFYIYSSSLADGLATLVIDGLLVGETQLVGGVGQIQFTPPLYGNTAWVTISKHNYKPYTSTVSITGDCVYANYSYTPGTTCVGGDDIVFTNESTGNIVTYAWDFGPNANPASASTAGPHTVTFNAAGWQTVTLDVWGLTDSSTYVDSVYVDQYCPYYMQTGTQVITDCSGKLFDDGGTGDYSSNTDYTTTISAAGATSLNINFLVFDVEAGQTTTCNYDYISIYDGTSTTSTLIGTYCNTTGTPGTFSTSGGDITIVQHSDANTEGDGFEMTWQCVYASIPPVAAFTASDTNTCNATINFTDYSTNGATSWLWNFGDGNTSTLENPSHSYAANGTYTVTLIATNTYGSDTLEKIDYIVITAPAAPIAIDGQRCSTGTIQIGATGSGTIKWYSSLGSTTVLNTGATYTTPSISTTTTYYAEDQIPGTSVYGGETNSSSNGSIYTQAAQRWLVFNVTSSIILKSVEVNAGGAGNRTIELQNSSGTVLESTTINIPNGTSRIDLDFEIDPGTDYRLVGPASPDLYRNNSNLSYPYDINSLVTITGSNANTPTAFYYYFYNWEVAEFCTSGRTPVDAEIIAPANLTLTTIGNTNLCPGDTVTLVAPTGATSYLWHPTNETSQSIVVTSNTGSYYVDYTIDSCSATSNTVVITVGTVPTASFTQTNNDPTINFTNQTTGGATMYFWDFDDGNTSTLVDPSHTYASNGLYNVMLIATNNCGSDTFYMPVNVLSVGIFENNIEDLRIFPNPAHSQLNIEFSIDEAQNIVIELYNQIGQIIWRDDLNKFNGSYSKSLAIEHLNSGVYLLRITNETSISTNKVVIQ